MSAVTHTPGQWELLAGTIIRAKKNGVEFTVCSVPESNQMPMELGDMFWETRANARLIAAAPELLAALQRIIDAGYLSDLQEFHSESKPCNSIESAKQQAIEALADAGVKIANVMRGEA